MNNDYWEDEEVIAMFIGKTISDFKVTNESSSLEFTFSDGTIIKLDNPRGLFFIGDKYI